MLTREECNVVGYTSLFYDTKTQTFIADASDVARYFVEDPTEVGIYVEGRQATVHFAYTGEKRDAEAELLYEIFVSQEGWTLWVCND